MLDADVRQLRLFHEGVFCQISMIILMAASLLALNVLFVKLPSPQQAISLLDVLLHVLDQGRYIYQES